MKATLREKFVDIQSHLNWQSCICCQRTMDKILPLCEEEITVAEKQRTKKIVEEIEHALPSHDSLIRKLLDIRIKFPF